MWTSHLSKPVRTLIGGVVCLGILGGMMVGHAWPLWTGQIVLLRARPTDSRDLSRGEFVRLVTPAARLFVVRGAGTAPAGYVSIKPLDGWAPRRGAVAFVQLDRRAETGEFEAVSIGDRLVDGAVNLRGRVRRSAPDGTVQIDYGLDAFYVQEGTAKSIERALVDGRLVQIEVAVAASGRARIRTLLVDGAPVR
jgi:uncharacterized membrane-anchored protein